MSEYLFFAFGGYNNVTEKLQSDIEVWNLSKMRFDDFVSKIREKMPNDKEIDYTKCLWQKLSTPELYEKCRWGLLIPWNRDFPEEFAIANLLNLYSPVFLYPRFHVNKHGAFGQYPQNQFEDDQNQSHEFAKDEFSTFFEKMLNVTPLLWRDISKTCEWEYDDCNLYMAHCIFEDLKAYHTKNPEKAGKEYADITMILELLLTTKDEREKPKDQNNSRSLEWARRILRRLFCLEDDGKITSRIKNRASVTLSLSGKKKEDIWNCINQRGSYLHGRFVQDVLDALREECKALSDQTQPYSSPSANLLDFDFSKRVTEYVKYVLVAFLYIHTRYREWCRQHGGFAKIADAAISDEALRMLLQGRVKEVLEILPY